MDYESNKCIKVTTCIALLICSASVTAATWLEWAAPTEYENGLLIEEPITGYRIHRNGEVYATTGNTTRLEIPETCSNKTWTAYTLMEGKESLESNEAIQVGISCRPKPPTLSISID